MSSAEGANVILIKRFLAFALGKKQAHFQKLSFVVEYQTMGTIQKNC